MILLSILHETTAAFGRVDSDIALSEQSVGVEGTIPNWFHVLHLQFSQHFFPCKQSTVIPTASFYSEPAKERVAQICTEVFARENAFTL